ncbi:MAG TPA: DUF2207 domain-containing protein, partial [Clostridia bacterium]|nr:DUF2207 domain-containing protein [Clostridia bacterium]
MKIKSKRIFTSVFFLSILIIILLLPSLNVKADNRSYYINNYDMTIEVQPNGDAIIEERLTYDFSGDFNGVLRDIDIDRTDGVTDLKIYVQEGNDLREFHQASGEGQDSYELTDSGSLVELKIYEKTSNKNKTFVYKYVLLNVAEKYDDIGVFNRKVIDSNWDVPLENIDIVINIPEGGAKEDLKVFAHGPLTGESKIVDDTTFAFSVPEIMPGTFVETLAIFPPELIGNSTRTYNETKLPSILDEEQKLADEANKVREEAREEMARQAEVEQKRLEKEARLNRIKTGMLPAFILAILGGLFSLVSLITKYSKDIKPEFEGDYYRDLPGDYSPAVMTYLLTKGKVDSKDIMATIMDLVRKKKITINKFETEKGLIFKKTHEQYVIRLTDGVDFSDLYAHEQFLISWFIHDLGTEGSLVLDDLKGMLKKRSNALKFQKDYDNFKNLAVEEGKKHNFFTKNDLRGSERFAIIALSLVGLGVLSYMLLKSLFGILITIIGGGILLAMLVLAFIQKRTKYGVEQTAMWKAFKTFLLHFSEMDKAEIPSIIIWEHYLVYAVSLGVAKEVIDQLPKVFTDMELRDPGLTYMGGYASLYTLNNMNNMFTQTASSINDAVRTASIASSSDSSGSGGGGGFSGGSSGGGGGG